MKNYMNWMLIGMGVVLLLVFILPYFGISTATGNLGTWVLVALIALCVLPMLLMRGGHRENSSKMDDNKTFRDNSNR